MSENLNPSLMTAEQKTTVLIRFSETLDVFAHQLPSDKQGLATLVTSAATSIRELAREVGKGDVDVAAEIITSTARLVGAVRKVVNASISKSTIR
jgi:predicted transcriptional regulator